MVFRMELTNSEVENILDMKYIDVKSTRYTFPPGSYESIDSNSMLKSLLPDDMKVNISNDDYRLQSNLNFLKTKKFTRKSIFILYWDLLNLIQDH